LAFGRPARHSALGGSSRLASKSGAPSMELTEFADSVWIAATPIRFAGIWFPHVMTVVRLADGSLLLHSPCHSSEQLTDSIRRIGSVAHVVAPNWFHDLYLTEYRALYPDATLWGPSRLAKLVDRVLSSDAQTPWYALMPHLTLPGFLALDESILFSPSEQHAHSRRSLDERAREREHTPFHSVRLPPFTHRWAARVAAVLAVVPLHGRIIVGACSPTDRGVESRAPHRGAWRSTFERGVAATAARLAIVVRFGRKVAAPVTRKR
jgi:hypothetical protein